VTAAAGAAADRASLARDEALLAEVAQRVTAARRALSAAEEDAGPLSDPGAGEAHWEPDSDLAERELSAEADAWLASLPADPLDADGGTAWEPSASEASEVWPAGLWPRDGGDGAGFAAGGVADTLPPGVVLAGLADRAWSGGLAELSDDELIGVMRAWRRVTSWAHAGELAAVTELDRRRAAQVAAGADPHLAEHVADEVAASLTLASRTADRLLDFAIALDGLPLTRVALAAGEIDTGKAHVIADEVTGLSPAHAAAVEAAVIGRAPGMTSGQLRAATHRAVLAADPSAAGRRRERARKDARVEVWHENSGTAALAGRDLPPAEVLAADKRITALARELKANGAQGTMDQLRAKVYTALLTGQSPDSLLASLAVPESSPAVPESSPAVPESSAGSTGRDQPAASTAASAAGPRPEGSPEPPGDGTSPAGGGISGAGDGISSAGAGISWAGGGAWPVSAGVGGSVNLTMPLATWLGASEAPGNVPGFGPLSAGDARELAGLLAARAGTRWCITLTDGAGRAVAHGCARAKPVPRPPEVPPGGDKRAPDQVPRETGQVPRETGPVPTEPGRATPGPVELTVTVRPLAVGECSHDRESAGYRPSPGLRHIVEIRNQRCTAPGCRRPATQCDMDHTVPYDQGGRTCECDLSPKCRRHHHAKQVQGWRVGQPEPGVLDWRLPHGRTYRVEPEPYE
jgi:hypothetical protein